MNKNLKKVISSIAALALSASCFTAFAADFSDVAADNAYKSAIDELVALKIVNGYEDGTFKPENEITRAEVTKMVVAAMGPSYTSAAESSSAATDFSDCAGHWATGYINVGVAQKFINGMGDGTFSPDTNVTYSQIVKMLVAALGYTTAADAAGGYPNGYLQIASSIGVTTGVAGLDADTAVTRGQVAKLISNAVKTPIVAITSWTTDIYGKPVAQTEVMDGNGDSEKYQTLLTEYHDAFAVRGRVKETRAQNDSIKVGQVRFEVEYADNFDGEKYSTKKTDWNEPETFEMYFGTTDAENLFYVYADAIVMKDEDDEYHLISITPYGKNEIVELSAAWFEDDDTNDEWPNAISFRPSENGKSKDYKLENDFEVYVNGVSVGTSIADKKAAVSAYIDGNTIGNVTLLDTPTSDRSKNGKYDIIMVDYYEYAIVESVTVGSTKSKIYFEDYQTTSIGSSLEIRHDEDEEDEVVCVFAKNGEEIALEDIKEDDIVLIKYNVVGGDLKDSSFVYVDVCDTVVEGTVSSRSKDNNGNYVYDIDGVDYAFAEADTAGILTVGANYILYLDAAGRFVKFDENATLMNYAIIDRVWSSNDGDPKVRLILADGTRVSYVVKKDHVGDAQEAAYGVKLYDQPLVAVANRVVSYKLNSKNEAYNFETVTTLKPVKGEYKADTAKIGSAKMSEATQVFDLSDGYSDTNNKWDNVNGYTVSDLVAGSINSFEDGEEYTILAGEKSAATGLVKVVVITAGRPSVGVNAAFAVVDAVNEGMVDGAERCSLDLYTAEGKDEIVSLFVDEEESEAKIKGLNRGDIIVYSLTGAGEMKNVETVFSVAKNSDATGITFDKAASFLAGKTAKDDPSNNYGNDWFFESGITSWDDSKAGDNNGYARVGFGAIIDKTNSTITLAKIKEAADDITLKDEDEKDEVFAKKGEFVSEVADIKEVDVASDVNVYVFDFNERDRAGSDRVTKGLLGSVVKTGLAKAEKFVDENGEDNINWSNATSIEGYANYAFYKTIDGEITDILVIIPKDVD